MPLPNILLCTTWVHRSNLGLDFIPSQTFLFFRFRQGPEDPHADRAAGVAQDIQEQHLPIRHTVSEQPLSDVTERFFCHVAFSPMHRDEILCEGEVTSSRPTHFPLPVYFLGRGDLTVYSVTTPRLHFFFMAISFLWKGGISKERRSCLIY